MFYCFPQQKLLQQATIYQIIACSHHDKLQNNFTLLEVIIFFLKKNNYIMGLGTILYVKKFKDHKCEFKLSDYECCKTLTEAKEEVFC